MPIFSKAAHFLHRASRATTRLARYFQSIWRYRYFWISLVRMDLRTRYRRSALGVLWSLLNPILMTIVLCTVFHTIMEMNIRDFGPYLLAGLAYWSFISASTGGGCLCFALGESYIRQHPAPMAIYPLRTVLGAMFHFLIALVVVMFVSLIARGSLNPVSLLSLVPTLALLFVMGWSLATLMGLSNVYFPDTVHLSEVLLQVMFYMTPIIYPAARLEHVTWLRPLIHYNPFAAFARLIREPILLGSTPGIDTWLLAAGTAGMLTLCATFALWRLERRVIFQL